MPAAGSQLSPTDERRRPRQTTFGTLSAGLIARGTVPAEILYGAEETDPAARDATVAQSNIIAAANLLNAQRNDWRVSPATDKAISAAQAAEEQTRPRESNFGSLSSGMIERGGALSRQILTAAQIELLLAPDSVAPERLLRCGTEAHGGGGAAADGLTFAIGAESADDTEFCTISEAEVVAPGREQPAPIVPAQYMPAPLEIVRAVAAEAVPAHCMAAEPSRTGFRSMTIWVASLLVWLLLDIPKPPAPTPMQAAAPVAETGTNAPDQLLAVVAESQAAVEPMPAGASPPVPAAAPAVEAAAEDSVLEPAPTVAFTRRRPGAVPDQPAFPVVSPAPPASPPAPAPSPTRAVTEATADLIRRGDRQLRKGEIAAARWFYERAAQAGDPQAMAALAGTYDPTKVKRSSGRGVRPDPERAQHWYTRAAETRARNAMDGHRVGVNP